MVHVCQVRRKWEVLSVISLFYYQYVPWLTTCRLGFLDSKLIVIVLLHYELVIMSWLDIFNTLQSTTGFSSMALTI